MGPESENNSLWSRIRNKTMSLWSQGSFILYGYNYFTKKGYNNAAKAKDWEVISDWDFNGKSFMITGANSGLGYSASKFCASRGGVVHMICRNKEKGEKAREEIMSDTKNNCVYLHVCDISRPKEIKECVEKFEKEGLPLDVLINNAGVMLDKKEKTPDNLDETFATNTLPTFLLTILLIPTLKKSKSPRVITVSSGGMLTEKLVTRENYDTQKEWSGRTAYARTKRHQLALNELFAEKYTKETGIGFYAMHPGWAETPAVITAMPSFYETFKKKLRTPEQGADTMLWLAGTQNLDPQKQSGEFFRDRQIEIKHFCISDTKYSKEEAEDLWKWCSEASGLSSQINNVKLD